MLQEARRDFSEGIPNSIKPLTQQWETCLCVLCNSPAAGWCLADPRWYFCPALAIETEGRGRILQRDEAAAQHTLWVHPAGTQPGPRVLQR